MTDQMKMLLVEDYPQNQKDCEDAVKDLLDDFGVEINLTIKGNVTEAIEALQQEFYDCVIIDMNLGDLELGGNDILDKIKANLTRIPVAIMTGTPDASKIEGVPCIGIYTKGEDTYLEIIKQFNNIYASGMTKVLGGRGIFEGHLLDIFRQSILPSYTKWAEYANADGSEESEKAIASHVMNHLLDVIKSDRLHHYPEEFYIHKPGRSNICTGSIFKRNSDQKYFVVLSPACDLVERASGNCKTDRALLVEIDELQSVFPDADLSAPLSNKNKGDLKNHMSFKTGHYHPFCQISGHISLNSFCNFRKVSNHTDQQLMDDFSLIDYQVSSAFIKDIIGRFSAYYARQGQPQIKYTES